MFPVITWIFYEVGRAGSVRSRVRRVRPEEMSSAGPAPPRPDLLRVSYMVCYNFIVFMLRRFRQ